MKSEDSLYEVLRISQNATQAEIKNAYRKLALVFHPDKNPSPDAREKFQHLQRVYSVLIDPEKRKAYDQTGSLSDAEDFTSEDFKSLYEFIKSQLEEVTEDKLDKFYNSYRGSNLEKDELLELFSRFKGNMKTVMEYLPCSDSNLDSHRFMDHIDAAIEDGRCQSTSVYKKWKARTMKRERPVNPLTPRTTSQPSSDLVAAIQKRRAQNLDPLISALEAKYGQKKPKKPRKK